MLRIERILHSNSRRLAPPRAPLTARCVLAAALGLSLAGVWACSTAGSDPTDEPMTVTVGTARSALSIAWLPPEMERWKPALVAAGERHEIDPALLAIVTLVESLGDPDAQSPSGAIGPMQLMPSTAARIAEERQLSGHSKQRLREPDYNVDLGAWYLSRQLALVDGSVERAAVAYNAGPRLVRDHEQGAPLPGETVNYRDLVVGMWNERQQPESATYTAWRERLAKP